MKISHQVGKYSHGMLYDLSEKPLNTNKLQNEVVTDHILLPDYQTLILIISALIYIPKKL
jgi:hypothetical protein